MFGSTKVKIPTCPSCNPWPSAGVNLTSVPFSLSKVFFSYSPHPSHFLVRLPCLEDTSIVRCEVSFTHLPVQRDLSLFPLLSLVSFPFRPVGASLPSTPLVAAIPVKKQPATFSEVATSCTVRLPALDCLYMFPHGFLMYNELYTLP